MEVGRGIGSGDLERRDRRAGGGFDRDFSGIVDRMVARSEGDLRKVDLIRAAETDDPVCKVHPGGVFEFAAGRGEMDCAAARRPWCWRAPGSPSRSWSRRYRRWPRSDRAYRRRRGQTPRPGVGARAAGSGLIGDASRTPSVVPLAGAKLTAWFPCRMCRRRRLARSRRRLRPKPPVTLPPLRLPPSMVSEAPAMTKMSPPAPRPPPPPPPYSRRHSRRRSRRRRRRTGCLRRLRRRQSRRIRRSC